MVQIRSKRKYASSARSREGRATLVILIVIPSILMGFFVCTLSILPDVEPNFPAQLRGEVNGKEKAIMSKNTKPFQFNKSLLAIRGGRIFRDGMEGVWESFLEEAVSLKQQTGQTMHVMEVGVHRPKECLYAAKLGLESHCIEPSPRSHDRIMEKVRKEPQDVQRMVRVYQMAASRTSGDKLEFSGNGGTGDHVGSPIAALSSSSTEISHAKTSAQVDDTPTTVSSVAIDDIISNKVQPTENIPQGTIYHPIEKIFALKIDTQGYEPSVFSGLKQSIQEHKIDFILTEYWPKGIDLMSGVESKEKRCLAAVEILQLMHNAGYELYASWNISHPKAPKEARRYINDKRINNIPYDDMMAHCQWYYDVEKKFPDDGYQMGYWSDVLGVSPNAKLAQATATQLSTVLSKVQKTDETINLK